MQAAEPSPDSTEIDLSYRSDKVESPQQYDNWRDYAFSDAPDQERPTRA